MTQWVKSIILDVTPDVRFTPESDRDNDIPAGRFVPTADGGTSGFTRTVPQLRMAQPTTAGNDSM